MLPNASAGQREADQSPARPGAETASAASPAVENLSKRARREETIDGDALMSDAPFGESPAAAAAMGGFPAETVDEGAEFGDTFGGEGEPGGEALEVSLLRTLRAAEATADVHDEGRRLSQWERAKQVQRQTSRKTKFTAIMTIEVLAYPTQYQGLFTFLLV